MKKETAEFLQKILLRRNNFATFDEAFRADCRVPDMVSKITKGRFIVAYPAHFDLWEAIGEAIEHAEREREDIKRDALQALDELRELKREARGREKQLNSQIDAIKQIKRHFKI